MRRERWRLLLTLPEARRNEEVVSIADSQVLQWIDQINHMEDADRRAKAIKEEIRALRREPNSVQNKRRMRALYEELDRVQFKPDYMCLIIDKEKDYYRACRGFWINGVRYVRLLGTNGGIKNSTIVFVSDKVADDIRARIENGRDPDKELVPAKLEAYKALTCSASIPVSSPKGVLVVNDIETEFSSDIVFLTDENDGEPEMRRLSSQKIKLNASDGFGLMCPALAERWSGELGLEYVVSGCNTRASFEKGMVFTFDFHEFAERIANNYIVTDAWGDQKDIRDVELILTTSMLKLWDSYESCDDYLSKSEQNGYTFRIAKTCPDVLENERCLNYQFIQPFDLDDDDIDELIKPTMDEISDVLCGDWRRAILYLKGVGLNDKSVLRAPDDFAKAIMADERVFDDPFVRNYIYQSIKNRINEAKVGVIKVHGNFSIVSGDPYLLCQHIFGLEPTGLLKAEEIFNRYWVDCGATELICFRAPMSCEENIRKVVPVGNEDTLHWYRYMDTCTIFNGWDTACIALNGCDFDGDLVMLTDNPVLLRRYNRRPALMCVQRKAAKRIPREEDLTRSNIESFGNEIGQITNRITSMYEVRSGFGRDSEEYETLSYRIMCGQLYQQNAIDKAKGIICKPMPRAWYSRHDVALMEDGDGKDLYRRIIADRKPYFMRYIYPDLMKQYNTFIKNTDRNSLREFGMTVSEIRSIPDEAKTERQKEFLYYYDRHIPVGVGACVMNKICRRFESRFDGIVGRVNKDSEFDYSILRLDAEYSPRQMQSLKNIYLDHNRRLESFSVFKDYERIDEYDALAMKLSIDEDFRRRCDEICPNSASLTNMILDMCYRRSSSKTFAWYLCGKEIVEGLLQKNGGYLSYPARDDDGDISFGGLKFSIKTVEVTNDDSTE